MRRHGLAHELWREDEGRRLTIPIASAAASVTMPPCGALLSPSLPGSSSWPLPFAMLYEPPDPVRQRLELVQLGMTHDEVEIAMDAAPILVELPGMKLDVLTFPGRKGMAEVHVSHETRRVVRKGWASTRRESDLALIWRNFFGQ